MGKHVYISVDVEYPPDGLVPLQIDGGEKNADMFLEPMDDGTMRISICDGNDGASMILTRQQFKNVIKMLGCALEDWEEHAV